MVLDQILHFVSEIGKIILVMGVLMWILAGMVPLDPVQLVPESERDESLEVVFLGIGCTVLGFLLILLPNYV
jgi:hypothetical protein